MNDYVIVGHCPQCGAPIYTEQVSMSISPPKLMPSCRCATKEADAAKTKQRGLKQ